ncbi:MAG: hypothetical protein ACOYNN_16440, partial [Terrimicrobiaceae bacterium]
GERLGALADEAIKQTQAGTDMFGAVPKKPLSEVYKALETPAGEPGLFEEPTPEVPVETKPESEPIDFDIDKPKEQIAKEINGLTIPELAQWSIDNAPNSAARAVAIKVKKVMDSLSAKKMFPEKVKVRNSGSRWTAGTRGKTRTIAGPLGVTFTLEFNGVDAKGQADRLTGTGYVTILHELLHVATNGELRLLQDTSQAYKDLNSILTKVRKQVKLDTAAGKKSPILSRIAGGANTIKNPRELVAWGLTDTDFQIYLSKIKVGKQKTLFNELVDVFRRLLGINEEYETALEAVVRATDQILEKPISEITAEIGKTGIRFEGEKAFTRQFKTDDGYTFYQLPDGRVVDNLDPNIVDMSWDNVKDFKKSVGEDVAEEGVDLGKLPPGRSRELAVAAKQLQQGNLTREQFEEMVNKYAPIAPVPAPRQPASNEAMRNALATNQKDKLNPNIADGTPVGLRMDINALRKGASVVSIHQGSNTSKVGQVIGYGSVAAATDVKFSNRNQQALLKVATGEGKLPAQTMEGKYKNISPEEAYKRVTELLNDPEWIQVGVDPTRHGYFYDRANAMPVKSADELIQVGNFVLAKNAQYDSKENYLYEQTGRQDAELKFKSDIPSEKWLKEKIEISNEYGKKPSGAPRSYGSVTGYFSRNIMIPVEELVKVKGENQEQQNIRQKDLDAIKKIMSESGRLPQEKDSDEIPLIAVAQDGTPYIIEGNHRIMAAKDLGFKYLPVEIKYFNGAEQESKFLNPEIVTKLDKQAHNEGYTLNNYAPQKEEIDEEFTAPIAIAKAKELLQKRKPIPMGAFADVDPKL